MNQKFNRDFERMTGSPFSCNLRTFLAMMFRHQIRYMYHFRRYENKKTLIRRVMMYRITRKYGLEISPDAHIGEGLYLGHPYNITVGSDVVLGKKVSLHKGCTIGGINGGKKKGSPTIGDCVYVGINSTIVGNIVIGDDVMICANTFVNFDVPSHSIVVSGGSAIHHKEHATEGYI